MTRSLILLIILFSNAASSVHAQTAQPTVSAVYTLGGPVYIGTANLEIKDPLTYKLQVYRADKSKVTSQNLADSVTEVYSAETQVNPSGRYSFVNVPLQTGDLYVITTTYDGETQGTIPYTYDGKTQPPELPITLYAGTTDSAKLIIVQNQQALSFVSAGVMRVLETMTVLNQGDRFYRSERKAPDGSMISVSFPLPIGARAIAFNTLPTSRFSVGGDANNPIVQDSKPVMPGQAQDIIYSYQIPYTKGAPIDRDYLYPLKSVQITLPADAGIVAQGLPFQSSKTTAKDTGRDLLLYALIDPPLKDGKRLIYTLDGAAKTKEITAPPPITFDAGGALIIAFIFIVILLVIVALLWRRGRTA